MTPVRAQVKQRWRLGPPPGTGVNVGLWWDAKARMWRPEDHPRDPRGRFARIGTGAGAADGPLTDRQFRSRMRHVQNVIGEARKTLATEHTHTDGNGAWTPERDRLHREIANELYAKAANVPRDGKAVIAGGLGGAGKTTVLRDHAGVDPSQYLTVNPDDIKEEMARRGLVPEVPDAPDLSPMERAALVHEESSRIGALLADMAYRDRRNMIWDITMSSEGSVRNRIDALQRHGYTEVKGVFVDIPVDVSVSRALARYRRGVDGYNQGKGHGGRFVPPSVIRAQRTRGGRTVNRDVFDTLKAVFSDWSVYDNSVTGRPPQLVERAGETAAPTGRARRRARQNRT